MSSHPQITFWEFLLLGFSDPFVRFFFTFLVVCGVLQIIVFPFYVYVNRKNRERDREALIYPITDSLYGLMKFSFVLFIVETINYPLWFYVAYVTNQTNNKIVFGFLPAWKMFSIFRNIGYFCDSAAIGVNHTFQFLLSVMAIQKFFLYFFEDTRRYIELSQRKMRIGIYLVYLLFGSTQMLAIVRDLACKERIRLCLILNPVEFITDTAVFSFYFVNIFFFITAFLYLPIMISIMKMSNLKTVKETQPQRYILWQTLAVLISKLGYIPLYFLTDLENTSDTSLDLSDLWYFIKFDNFTAPLTMELSYLGCNKKNLGIMFGYVKKKFKLGSSDVESTMFERTSISQRRSRGSTS